MLIHDIAYDVPLKKLLFKTNNQYKNSLSQEAMLFLIILKITGSL